MSNTACTPARPRRGLASATGGLFSVLGMIGLALQVRAERRRLLSLDEGALKDMGFNKGQAQGEGNRSFWDLPVDRIRS